MKFTMHSLVNVQGYDADLNNSNRWQFSVQCVPLTAQSIPRVAISLGICHFVLEKLQMSHGGAGRSYKKPTMGL